MKPSGEVEPSIEQLLNHYEAVKDQITALEHRKKELSEQIKKKLAGQAELLKKLGLADDPVVDVPAPGAPPK